MEFIIDKSGALSVKILKGKYINVLPLTKYQFERFIWETAPEWCDYNEIIKTTGRVTPTRVNKQNHLSALLSNINFDEALEISRWFGSRPPTAKEWDVAYDMAFGEVRLFKEALIYMEKAKERSKLDIRMIRLIENMHSSGVKRKDLYNTVGELVCEYPLEPFGRIYLKRPDDQLLVTGKPSTKTRDLKFVYCGIVEI